VTPEILRSRELAPRKFDPKIAAPFVNKSVSPLAEYLAGIHLVNESGSDEERWQNILARADSLEGAPRSIKGFLLAFYDCCLAKSAEAHIPAFVINGLAKRGGLDSEHS
jgi:hypothetical protein